MERELLELRRLRFYLNKSKQRIRHVFRERPDHFEQWIDTEFHKSARMVLERINSKLTYVVQSLLFTDIVASWLKFMFESGSRDNQIILGDGGYAGYNASTYLMIHLDNPRSCAEKLYNESQIRTRNLIERCFGIWKRGFPILSMGLRVNLSTTQDIKSAIF
ncbi:hypothetical protein CVS40_10353 [Lucilia cuprina]|nr:hypothetical protein CVS40_10353 [Lucilia cuprina]